MDKDDVIHMLKCIRATLNCEGEERVSLKRVNFYLDEAVGILECPPPNSGNISDCGLAAYLVATRATA